jgi:AcrR family transcriptional regulator
VDRKLTTRGAATRQRIVDSAAVLIRERGAADTHLDDIRHATSTSKSQLFHYFPGGRSDLLCAVAQYEADQVLQAQQPQLGELTSWNAWLSWRRVVIAHYLRQGPRCPLGSLTTYLSKTSPAAQTIITGLYETWEYHLAEGVRALQSSGEASTKLKPEEAAKGILTAIQGGATLMQLTSRIDYLEASLDAALQQIRLFDASTSA